MSESVWDYPRPPRVEPVSARLAVDFAGIRVAETSQGARVLETSHPPVYLFPPQDVRRDLLIEAPGSTLCEFKGRARYFTLAVGARRSPRAAWCYPDPTPPFAHVAGWVAFYASRVDAAWVGDAQVAAQTGDFYGGWITPGIIGPFKGGPGTLGW